MHEKMHGELQKVKAKAIREGRVIITAIQKNIGKGPIYNCLFKLKGCQTFRTRKLSKIFPVRPNKSVF